MTINTVFDIFNPESDTPAVIEAKAISFANNMVSATAEINAAIQAMNFNATISTSTTSWTVANTGSKTFDIDDDKSYAVGMTVKVASTASPTNWGLGDVTAASSGSITVAFRVKNGSGTLSAWTISQNAEIATLRTVREARTGNTQIVSADVGKFIDVTSGTFTQTFAAASALMNGFFLTYRNSGTGVVTLDPNGAETIEGNSTLTIGRGETYHIVSNGSNLFAYLESRDFGVQELVLHTGNGYGSSNTKYRRWSTVFTNAGVDISYADSSTTGGKITINTAGMYHIERKEPAAVTLGVGRNCPASTTINFPSVLTFDNILLGGLSSSSAGALNTTRRLNAGDELRGWDAGTSSDTSDSTFFRIRRVG